MTTVLIIIILVLVLAGGLFLVSSSSKKRSAGPRGSQIEVGRDGSVLDSKSEGSLESNSLTSKESSTKPSSSPSERFSPNVEGVKYEVDGSEASKVEYVAGADKGDSISGKVSDEIYVAEGPSSDLNGALARTKGGIGSKLSGLFKRSAIDESFYEELEEALILSDVGVEVTMKIVEDARNIIKERKVKEPSAALEAIREAMSMVMSKRDRSLHDSLGTATVWLFVGVNGVGKTTTIGKVANRYSDRKLLLAAGDTFRAAASDQLTIWADRASVPIVQGTPGADPSSVIFDAIASGRARGSELILCDTAGRLQNKTNLIEELKKIYRTVEKAEGILGEVLLVLDATTGQNGLSQAKIFSEAVGVTGVVLTKLDGSAKGGIAFAIEETLNIPVKLVGVGEGIGDLVDFDPVAYVESLTQVD